MSRSLNDLQVLLKLINDDKFLLFVLVTTDIPADDKLAMNESIRDLRLEFPNGMTMDTLKARLKGCEKGDGLD